MKKRKFIIGGLVLFLAIGYLMYMGINSSASYSYTVSELMAKSKISQNQSIRVNGKVLAGSVEQRASSLNFTVTEGGINLPVVYSGSIPDTFRPDGDIVVVGTLGAGGIFQAETLMPKCPSKYKPAAAIPSTKGINSWQI